MELRAACLLFLAVTIVATASQTTTSSLTYTPATESTAAISTATETTLSTTEQQPTEPTTTTTATSDPAAEPTEEPTAEPTTEPPLPGVLHHHYDYSQFYCSCDLEAGQCDTNCCCDPDCSAEERRLFLRCWTPPESNSHSQHCSSGAPENLFGVAWNNTDHKKIERQNGLFCIVTDNTPRRRMYEEKPPISDDQLLGHFLPRVANRWDSNAFRPEMEKWIYEPFYKVGFPIFTLDVHGTIDVLKLPGALNSASCNVRTNVAFLEPGSQQCYLTDCQLESSLANLSVFRLPPLSVGDTASSGNTAQKTVPIVRRVCDEQSGCRSDLSPRHLCPSALKSLTFRIGFNSTEGIRYVLADLLYGNETGGVVQFETAFYPLTPSHPVSSDSLLNRSGNPGYQLGKPLLVASFNATGEDGKFQSLRLFPNAAQSRTIRFGEDSFQADYITLRGTGNLTRKCSTWRTFVFENFWGRDISQWRVASYGNAELNVTAHQWMPIHVQQRGELTCLSRSVRSDLIVLYARSGSYEQPQLKLLNVVLQLESDPGAGICETADCRALFTQSVVFVMIDSPTYTILPQPPRWRIEVPRDFFYPFLLNSSPTSSPLRLISLLVVSVSFRFTLA